MSILNKLYNLQLFILNNLYFIDRLSIKYKISLENLIKATKKR